MSSMYLRLSPTRLAVLDMCDYYGEGQIITRINVPESHRGLGHGRALLKQALDWADSTQTALFLEINPSGPLDYHQLADWYERHGFREIATGMWRRKPQKGTPQ